MLEPKHQSSKILKRINVHSFIREGGEVVKGFTRLQEVKIPELLKNSQNINYRPIEELLKHVNKLREDEIIINDSNKKKFQKDILGIYCDGIHGISDPGLSLNSEHLYDVYAEYSKDYFEEDTNPLDAYKKLTNPKYLRELYSQSLELERRFKEFGISTERTNPFIFRSKLNLDENVNISDQLKYYLFVKYARIIHEDFNISLSSYEDIITKSIEDGISKIERVMKETSVPQKKLEKTIIPSIMLLHLLDPKIREPFAKPLIDLEKNSKKIDKNLMNFIKSDDGLPEDIRNYNDIMKDPDANIKKPFLKFLNSLTSNEKFNRFSEKENKLSMLMSKDHLIKWMKDLKPDEIVPNFVYLMENGLALDAYKENSNTFFKNSLNNITKEISSELFKHQNSWHSHVYVSNNPMDFVTMSPQGTMTSCQSITKHDGNLGVNQQNANIINSLNLDKSHDFLLYTLSSDPSKKNTKGNRTSVHENIDDYEFSHFEEKKIYAENDYLVPLHEYLTNGNGKEFQNNVMENDNNIYDELREEGENLNNRNSGIRGELFNLESNSYNFQHKEVNRSKELVDAFKENGKHKDFDSIKDIDNYINDIMDRFDVNFGTNEEHTYDREIDNELEDMKEGLNYYLRNVIEYEKKENGSMLYGSRFHGATLNINTDYDDVLDIYSEDIISDIDTHIEGIKDNRSFLSEALDEMRDKIEKIMEGKQ